MKFDRIIEVHWHDQMVRLINATNSRFSDQLFVMKLEEFGYSAILFHASPDVDLKISNEEEQIAYNIIQIIKYYALLA